MPQLCRQLRCFPQQPHTLIGTLQHSHVAIQQSARQRFTGLSGAHQIAGTPKLQILLRYNEAVIGPGQNPQSFRFLLST